MIDAFLDDLRLANRSLETLRAYERDLRRLFGRRDPRTASAEQLKRALAKMTTSARSKARARAAMSSFCKWMVVEGYRDDNPTLRVPAPKFTPALPTYLERAEMDAIRGAAAKEGNPMHIALLAVLFGTGLRISECLALKSDALANGTLIVRGKGGKERAVPISDAVRAAVANWRVPEGQARLFLASRQSVARLLVHYAEAAGLPNAKYLHPHTCRHTAGFLAYEATGDLRAVQEMLGHADPKTTMVYTQLSNAAKKRAVEAIL